VAHAEKRAGLIPGGHNHGEDWGLAGMFVRAYQYEILTDLRAKAVEMGCKRKLWADGIIR
jgi:hypothetical protein